MTPEQEQQIFMFMGKIDERTKDLLERFDSLPCTSHKEQLEDLTSYKNQVIGKISVIAAVMGAIGYVVSMAVGWLIQKHS